MNTATKNLKYYLANPDEMPTDPKELEKLANEHMDAAMESGTEQINVDNIVGKADVKDEKVESSTAEVKTDEAAEAEAKAIADALAADKAAKDAQAAKDAATVPSGILAKDGVNVIPYSQLESARSRATAAEALVREQAARLAELEKKTEATPDDVEMLTEAELETLEQDSPTLAKTLRAQQHAIRKLSETVQTVTQHQNHQLEAEASSAKSEVQSAIDANPTLAAWQTDKDQTLWEEASRFDRLLRESPKYKDVSFADRFAKVVRLTQEAQGLEVETSAKDEVVVQSAAEIKAAAAAKLKAAKPGIPTSLSDIPGGAPPAVDEKDKVEQMSPVALGQMFLSMTPDQQRDYLSQL